MTPKPRAYETPQEASDELRSILLRLKPTGQKGFEGLVRDVVQAATGLEYRLKNSGFQEAVDAVGIQGGRRHVLETKLYRKNVGLPRHIMATLAYCATAAFKPDLIVFAATVEIDADLRQRALQFAEQNAIEVMFLDWGSELPDLAVLLAEDAEFLPRFLHRIERYAASDRARLAVQALQSSPRFSEASRRLLSHLQSATLLFEVALSSSVRRHIAAMSIRSQALQLYGQALCPLLRDAQGVITRDQLLQKLDEAATERTPIIPAPIVVLGDEGVGKTWLVAQWWLTRQRNRLLLFVPSSCFRGYATDDVTAVASILDERLMEVLNPPDRLLSGDQDRRRRMNSERFRLAAQNRMLIVLDGLNETPDADWPRILEAVWRYTIRFSALLVVTTRPAFWRRHQRVLSSTDWSEPVPVHVDGFSRTELEQVCTLGGIDPETIPPFLMERLGNPRILSLALKLLGELRRAADFGIDRLLYAYWGQRQTDRADLGRVDPDHDVFLQGLAQHAEEFHRRRLEAVRSGRQDLSSEDVSFDLDDFRNRFRGLERYSRLDSPAAPILIGEIREGRFFADDLYVPASGYVFRKESLAFALGLYLVGDLVEQVRTLRSEATVNILHERLAVLLEPVFDFDQTADQLMAAVTIACRDPDVTGEVRITLLEQLLELRNRPQALKFALSALALEAPETFCSVAQRALERSDPRNFDAWLVDALRYMVSANVGLPVVGAWIVAPTAEDLTHCSGTYPPVSDPEKGRLYERLAAMVLIGQNLAPMAGALYDWAALATSRQPFGRPDKRFMPLARTPIAQLIRFNDADPESLTAALLSLESHALARGAVPNALALAALLALIGDPQALPLAEEHYPGIAQLVDPPDDHPKAPWRQAFNPETPIATLHSAFQQARATQTSSVLDPSAPEGEALMALAARMDPHAYIKIANTAFSALAGGSDSLEAEALRHLAVNSLAALASARQLSATDIKALFSILAVSDQKDARQVIEKVERTREALMAWLPEDSYCAILEEATRIVSGQAKTDFDSLLQQRDWYPALSAAFATSILSQCMHPQSTPMFLLVRQGLGMFERLESNGTNSSSGGVPVPVLDVILQPEPQSGIVRSLLFAIASRTQGLELARLLVQHQWACSAEPDKPLGREISTFLAATLAGKVSFERLAEMICPMDLPTLAEGVTDEELPRLSDVIAKYLQENRGQTLAAPTSIGASRLVGRGTWWIAEHVQWLHRAVKAMIEGTHPTIDAFTAALICGAQAPIPGAVDYLRTLLNLTPIRRELSALRILKPTLAAAALEPNRRHGLLDSLILGLTEDRLLAELVYVARELGPPALAMLRDYAATLSSSGRTVRMAYGLMLEMLLHERESVSRRPPSLANGYLAEIEKYVQDIQRGHEAAAWWAEKYWVESDPGSEYLAMTGRSDPLPWSPPDSTPATEPDKIKALFLFRFQEQARAWGYGTLFGWSQLERWLTARKPVF